MADPCTKRGSSGYLRRTRCIFSLRKQGELEECLIVGCLALNASFEPLTMVPMRRALRLVIDGKAEIIEADAGRVVRSERLTLPRPAVIRLTRFIHVPRRFRRQVTNTFLLRATAIAVSTAGGCSSSSSRANH